MSNFFRFNVALAAAAIVPAALAQQPRPPASIDPAAPVPAVMYESAFAGYTPYRDENLAPWREVNDEVARVGGHIGILKGAGAGQQKPPTPAATGR